MSPGDKIPPKNGFPTVRKTNLNRISHDVLGEKSNLYQICPACKKLVLEDDLVCPFCAVVLSNIYLECPFCKNQISDIDTSCPHCNKLLIYEQPKKVAAKRNVVLMPLGLLLLASMLLVSFLNWKGIKIEGYIRVTFMVLWMIGFALYGAYIGKGDKDFWFGQ